MRGWRKSGSIDRLEQIAKRDPPRIAVDLAALADMASTLIDGGIVSSKATKEQNNLLPQQVMLYAIHLRHLSWNRRRRST